METDWSALRERCLVTADEAILALNKPAGIAVTGERHDTDIVELAAAAGRTLYPVHRIDKATSGLVLLATDLTAHGELTRQFNKQTAQKAYLAIVSGEGLPERGEIDLPLSVGRKNRVRIAAQRAAIRTADDESGCRRWYVDDAELIDTTRYPSLTRFATLARTDGSALLVVRPVSGRRHQIRVHLAWIGHTILGDPLFDKSGARPRAHLHSWRLGLTASWRTPPVLDLEAGPGADFWEPLPAVDPDILQRANETFDVNRVTDQLLHAPSWRD
ncbi:pseudouridine synthase family protein [Nocardia arizonensis]|uniref:pseudouridine synthase family protein n=1 Tax=Nocardia arizonensis TaxID=1141647 RepID=UPI0006CFBCD5|nr:RNA pseudouridine synthase [Nocardia arizonensis]